MSAPPPAPAPSATPTPPSSDAARAAFERYLREHNIKLTEPRQHILTVVLEMRGHFEAEEVLEALRRRGRRVGKATVYRTLPLLVSGGVLRQVRFDARQAHYEQAFGDPPHDHIVCQRCGRIIEFAADEIVELRNRIAREHHFHVVSHRFQLSGLCWECSIDCPVAKAVLPVPGAARSPGTRTRPAATKRPPRHRRPRTS